MKVLVANDSPVMRRIVVRSLDAFGVTEVFEVADGAAGWERFQLDPIDIVLTDSSMPEMSGVQFVQEIRGAGSDVPVIVISPENEAESVAAELQDSLTQVVCRPFAPDTIQKSIEKFGFSTAE